MSASSPENGNSSGDGASSDGSKGKRLNPIKRKQMEDRIHEIEEDIARVEATIAHCETALLTFVSAEETQRQTQELDARRQELSSSDGGMGRIVANARGCDVVNSKADRSG